jgi:hypothetical protein
MVNNDNNLLLIILIGIVLFWIFNINTTEKFTNNNSINNYSRKKKSKSDSLEHYKEDTSAVSERSRAESPLLNAREFNDKQLIDTLYREKMSVSESPKSIKSPSTFSNGIKQNQSQKILQTPPNIRDSTKANQMGQEIAKQFIPNSKQQMTSGDNPVGQYNDSQNSMSNLDQGYMLLPQNFMPDKKFEKVMPPETRSALTSDQLLPREENQDWFQVPNSKFNLLQAVDLEVPEIKIGIDTVGQSRKNATYDLRAAPPCPKFVVSPWSNSTIEPDYNTRPLC